MAGYSQYRSQQRQPKYTPQQQTPPLPQQAQANLGVIAFEQKLLAVWGNSNNRRGLGR
jgi:hypothetical protein